MISSTLVIRAPADQGSQTEASPDWDMGWTNIIHRGSRVLSAEQPINPNRARVPSCDTAKSIVTRQSSSIRSCGFEIK